MALSCFEILDAIVQTGGFRAAAEHLGVTQSYLSQYVRKLEEQCYGKIIDRHSQPLRLTELGVAVYGMKRRISLLENDLQSYCEGYARLDAGRIRIACNGERTAAMLVGAVSEFSKAHPGVALDLTQELRLEEIPVALTSGQADVGILYEYLLTPELNAYPLFRERYLMVVPDRPEFATFGAKWNPEGEYPLIEETDVSVLAKIPFMQTMKHEERTVVLEKAVGFALPETNISVRVLGTRLAFAAAGVCACVCQETLLGDHESKHACRFASLENVLPVQTVVVAWLDSEYRSRAAGAFCETVRQNSRVAWNRWGQNKRGTVR